jgi:hypothetical protein
VSDLSKWGSRTKWLREQQERARPPVKADEHGEGEGK